MLKPRSTSPLGYGKTPVVHELSIEVADGEAVSLVGPNGAGKTTTLSAIAGLVKPVRRLDPLSRPRDQRRGARAPRPRRDRAGPGGAPDLRHPHASRRTCACATAGAGPRRRRRGDRARAGAVSVPARPPRPARRRALAAASSSSSRSRARCCAGRGCSSSTSRRSGSRRSMVDLVFETLDGLREEGVTILLVEQNATPAAQFADRTYVFSAGTLVLPGRARSCRDTELDGVLPRGRDDRGGAA